MEKEMLKKILEVEEQTRNETKTPGKFVKTLSDLKENIKETKETLEREFLKESILVYSLKEYEISYTLKVVKKITQNLNQLQESIERIQTELYKNKGEFEKAPVDMDLEKLSKLKKELNKVEATIGETTKLISDKFLNKSVYSIDFGDPLRQYRVVFTTLQNLNNCKLTINNIKKGVFAKTEKKTKFVEEAIDTIENQENTQHSENIKQMLRD